MKVGFTGTQNDLSVAQFDLLLLVMQELEDMTEAHHGDCVGADATFSAMVDAMYPNTIVHIHPPTVNSKRANCRYDETEEAFSYLTRNKHIVDATDVLLACPKTDEEELRSGTWATIRYARKRGKPIAILWNDGKYIYENKGTIQSGKIEEDATETSPLQDFLRRRSRNLDSV